MYNLQGADQTLNFLVQQEEESNGDDSEQFRFRYTLPLFAKPYELKWQLNRSIENTEVDDFENVETIDLFSMAVSRDWHIDALEIPLKLETAITFAKRRLDEPYPDSVEAREAGSFNRLKLELIFDDVHRERYRRFGSYYSVAIASGFDWLDSDYDSIILGFQAIGFRPLNRYDNFNYRFVFGAANNSPFDFSHYSIGGASNIRGLESVDDRGDAIFFPILNTFLHTRNTPVCAIRCLLILATFTMTSMMST